MVRTLLRSLWLVLIVVGVGCEVPPSENATDASVPPPVEPMISLDGTVTYVDLEGGFYGITADDGQTYVPLNLDELFQQDSLRVHVKMREESTMTTREWGTPVRVVVISKL